jgi:hypothetical protein
VSFSGHSENGCIVILVNKTILRAGSNNEVSFGGHSFLSLRVLTSMIVVSHPETALPAHYQKVPASPIHDALIYIIV